MNLQDLDNSVPLTRVGIFIALTVEDSEKIENYEGFGPGSN